ncbi:MAG: 6,7-dimethyl-8-ribityllumazine synthase [Pseudomonadota bacterium]|nr:6,7-dimethyl-8-ribityllumazine synthase [Pseudomonadota bacterium]
MSKILIVESLFYEDIAEQLNSGAVKVVLDHDLAVDKIAVPGVFEIPSAVAKAWASKKYLGVITLGCVIRGATDHYDHICREVARAIMDLTVKNSMPLGFGILTCDNFEQAWERANVKDRDIGGRAAIACIRMLDIHKKISDG